MAQSPPLYSPESLAVEFYDHGLPSSGDGVIAGDVAFYADLAREADGPVLELGAGTGRVSWALAAEGVDVLGLDLSKAMLACAEAKRAAVPEAARNRAVFSEGDMADFDLGRAFGLTIAPFRAFQNLLSAEAQRKCLTCVRRHLRPGGRMALHLFDPLLEYLVPGSEAAPTMRDEIRHPDSGRRVTREIVQRTADPLRQVTEAIWEYQEVGEDGAALRRQTVSESLRWTYRWEMRYLLELSGFEVEVEYSDFKGSPPTYGREQIWVARRP